MTLDLFTGATGRTDDAETLAELEVDYTPPAVAVQLLLALREEVDWVAAAAGGETWPAWAPHTLLDPAAGSGCWGRAMRAVFGADVHLTGIEPRESERGNVMAAYDESYHSDLSDVLAVMGSSNGCYDLVATNPPFSAFERGWPAMLLEAGALANNGVVALYGLSQWGQSEGAQEVLRAWPPALQLRVGGRVAHRGDGKADAREYSLWVWSVADLRARRRHVHPSWRTVQLPVLPTELRRWSPAAVPGTYAIDPSLVERIRRDL